MKILHSSKRFLGISVLIFLCLGALIYKFNFAFPYLLRPRLIYFYVTQPGMRELMNIMAGERTHHFHTFWDNAVGISLSKSMFRPVMMNGQKRYAYLPNLRKLSFETGVGTDLHKFEAPDSPRLRKALKQLNTPFIKESTFNVYGRRATDFEWEQNCGQTVYFAGDSFTEGLWVGDQETFANQLMHALNRQASEKICAVNAGVNGYNIFEQTWTAKQDHKLFKYQTLLLFPYANDIENDEVTVLRGEAEGLDDDWKAYLNHLKTLSDFTHGQGIRLIVVPIPPKEQYALPESRRFYQEKLETFCQQHGVEFWDPLKVFLRHRWEEIYLDWDPHLNASGHQILANFLEEKMRH